MRFCGNPCDRNHIVSSLVVATLRRMHYKAENYDHYGTTLPTKKRFTTMGKYFRRTGLCVWARIADDVDEAA